MSKAAIVSGRVTDELASKLDRLADRMERPRGWLVARAVEHYVLAELALLESLDEAEAQIERGDFSTQEEMERWFADRCAAPPHG